MAELMAIRDRRNLRGKAHLDDGYTGHGYAIPECGSIVRYPETLPWEQTAPEDRCKLCAKRAIAEEATGD